MYKTQFFIFVVLFVFGFSGVVFSASPICPEPPEMIDIDVLMPDMRAQAKSNIETCLAAYNRAQEASVTDFSCPSGSMFVDDFRGITPERFAYRIGVATMFKYIDDSAMQYARSLQCMRDTDPIKWNQTNTHVIYGNGTQLGYEDQYKEVCTIQRIMELLNESTYAGMETSLIIKSSDAFPYYCSTIAEKKILALENLTTLLASKGVGKGFQNNKDVFLESVKGKYATLLEKFSRYLRLISQAVAKVDTYLRRTIQ